jgi:sulfide:quinone oxidoreductase
MGDRKPRHVLIAGGGVAALEAALALAELAPDRVDVELLAPEPEFVYRPLLVAEPFGTADVLRLNLAEIAADVGARLTTGALASVDPAARTVATAAGGTIPYDSLLIALGARPVEAVPGALTFGDGAERRRFGELLAALGRRGSKRVLFVVPRQVGWSIAAYELALLTAAERDARKLFGVEIVLVTHEAAPLDVFGPSTSQLVAKRLERAGVDLRTASVADRVSDGRLLLDSGEWLDGPGIVALPALEVPPIDGVPQRDGGFVQTDVRMQVAGLESVWAAGDVTWFPIKQGGLAAQQSDTAARAIAVAAGAHVPIQGFHPVLRAALITGGSPAYLRAALSPTGAEAGEASVGRGLWWPPEKLAGRYLGPYVARRLGEQSPDELLDLQASAEVGADADENVMATRLLLAAADADAGAGDFEGALSWLSLVERLDLVIPAAYVARRDEWRRRLDPGLGPGAAATRMDPTFASAEAAMSDLQRRLGWLREIEDRTSGGMTDHLDDLDRGMEGVRGLARRAGLLQRRGSAGR